MRPWEGTATRTDFPDVLEYSYSCVRKKSKKEPSALEPGLFLQLWQLLVAEFEGQGVELGLIRGPAAVWETCFLLWGLK